MADLAQALAAYVVTVCGAVDVEVHSLGLAEGVRGEVVRFEGDPCGPAPVLRLELVRADGLPTRLTVRPRLTVWVDGWVAANDAELGGVVDGIPGRIVLDRATAHRVSSPGPYVARGAVRAGQPLVQDLVAPRPDVRMGQPVQLVVVRGAVALTAPGRLLEDASTGEEVRVHNEATDTVQRGVLRAPDRVELR